MTAGGRSNSSGAGVSSLVSGSSANDRVINVNQQNDIQIKVNQNNDTHIKVHHSTNSSAGAHHSDDATNTRGVIGVRPFVDLRAHD